MKNDVSAGRTTLAVWRGHGDGTTQIRVGAPRSRSSASYSLSLVASGWVLVATIAGAITIPIKASAIKKSCIRSSLGLRSSLLQRQIAQASAVRWPSLEGEPPHATAQAALNLENRSAADLPMNHRQDERSLEIPQKPAEGASVLYCLPLWRVTKDNATQIYGNSICHSVQ